MNILIFGLGSIGKKHVDAILQLSPDSHIIAFRSGDTSSQYKTVKSIYTLSEVSFDPDFIIIANPTHLHLYTVEDIISKFHCPLFIEKPLSHMLDGVSLLYEKIKEKNIFTYVACNLRFHPIIQYFKKQLTPEFNQRIQEVNTYCGSYLPEWRPNRNFRDVYSAHKAMGGGVHLDLIHELDYCYWFWGVPAQTHKLLTSHSALKIDAVDYANYNLVYENFTTNIILNYYRRDPKRTIEIVLDDTTWRADLLKCHIVNSNDEIVFSANYNPQKTYEEQMKYFMNEVVNKQKDSMNTFKNAVDVLKICLKNNE